MDREKDVTLNEETRQVMGGRDFGLGVPIVITIGWLVLAYFLVYSFLGYIGPAFFGMRRPMSGPFAQYPWPFTYYRTMRLKRAPFGSMEDMTALTAKVTQAIEKRK